MAFRRYMYLNNLGTFDQCIKIRVVKGLNSLGFVQKEFP